MGSAGCPTSAAVPADSTVAETPSIFSRCAKSASAIGLRQMLPVQTMRIRLNTTSRAPRARAPAGAQERLLSTVFCTDSRGGTSDRTARRANSARAHGLGARSARVHLDPWVSDGDPRQGTGTSLRDPVTSPRAPGGDRVVPEPCPEAMEWPAIVLGQILPTAGQADLPAADSSTDGVEYAVSVR